MPQKAPLKPLPICDTFGTMHMDILELPTSKEKYTSLLLVVDSMSRWPEAFPLRSQEASEIAKVLYQEIFTRYGAPHTLISDRGQNFMSKLVSELCKLFQVTRHHTSSYHPQTNSKCEVMNRTIAEKFRAYCNDKQDDWPKFLPAILMAYGMTPPPGSSQIAPYYLLFGRHMRTPLDTALTPPAHLGKTADEQMHIVLDNLKEAHKMAKENIEDYQMKYKRQYDKNTKPCHFQAGQRVWLHSTARPIGVKPKLFKTWQGPYYVTEKGPNNTFAIRRCDNNKQMKALVHANRLKYFHDPSDQPYLHVSRPPQPSLTPTPAETQGPRQTYNPDIHQTDQADNQTTYPVQRLTATKFIDKVRHFNVLWGDGEKSWHPEGNISDVLIREYYTHHTKTGRRRKRKPIK